MEVRVNNRGRILWTVPVLLPATVVMTFLSGLVGAAGLVCLLEDSVGVEQARAIAIPVAGAAALVAGLLYLRWLANSLARYQISLEHDVVIIRIGTGWRAVEKRYPVNEIAAFGTGERLNSLERTLEALGRIGLVRAGSVRLIKELKARRLFIIDKAGDSYVIPFADKVFDRDSLHQFAAALAARGVVLAGIELPSVIKSNQ